MNRIKNWVLGIGFSLLAACTTNPLLRESPLSLNALEFCQWVLVSDDVGRSRLEAHLLDEGTQQNAVIALVQLALLRSVDREDSTVEYQALDLLGSLQDVRATASREAGYRAFGALWRQYLEARIGASENDTRIAELEAQRNALREQIEALTSIEEQLNRRTTP